MSYPYRCIAKATCGHRKTLPERGHHQVCPACGGEMREDKSRKRYTKAHNCWCGGVYGSSLSGEWPHRRGCLGCEHYTGPIDLEAESYGGYGGYGGYGDPT